jgi:hypothetical protein
MTGEKLKEFMRRLNKDGYRFELDDNGVGTIYSGHDGVEINADGEIRYKREHEDTAHRIHALYGEVDEYMTAYLAAPDNGDRTRTLLKYNNAEFAARDLSKFGIDFVTWRLDRNGLREHGNYFDSYAKAKEDFAMRCGLIDRSKLFTETELLIIRAGLADIGDITPDRGQFELRDIRAIKEKVNDLVIPQIHEQEQEAEDLGVEPEIDM